MKLKRIKWSKMQLKTVFYISFFSFIICPILIVLVTVLNILNQEFKKQAIENIKQVHETIVTELVSDIGVMSMRLSHLIYSNNNEILDYAAGTDSEDLKSRYDSSQKLNQASSLALEPASNIISVGFYMKDQRISYYKNTINKSYEETSSSTCYRTAVNNKNQVVIGFINNDLNNGLYAGAKKNSLVLVFAFAPDRRTDRSEKIEMVMFYQNSGVADKIKNYNREYLKGNNNFGIMEMKSSDGENIFTTLDGEENYNNSKYTQITTPLKLYSDTWYINSYIKTSDLSASFWRVALWVLLVALIILLLVGYYSSYFLRSIVKPIQRINYGLRQIEEGELQIHIEPGGQYEIRTMIHSFNSMVRRLQVLISDYEEKVRTSEKTLEDYFTGMITGEITPAEVNRKSKYFFEDSYVILGFVLNKGKTNESEYNEMEKLHCNFERNLRFSSRCIAYIENPTIMYAFYRITEEDYVVNIYSMIQELQKSTYSEHGIDITVCISKKQYGYGNFLEELEHLKGSFDFRFLKGKNAIVDCNKEDELMDQIIQYSNQYLDFSKALYIADERTVIPEKEKLFEVLNKASLREGQLHVLGLILEIAKKFYSNHANFYEIFGEQYNYYEKLERIEDIRSLKLWLTNYIDWIIDYSVEKLYIKENDIILKAKRYIGNHYENSDLTLKEVADYVELNEKYFTSKFSKETGETFISYLTSLRIEKAKDLLKTTNFKIYEIAEMVGYRNVENFNRVFKKNTGTSPAQYRKTA